LNMTARQGRDVGVGLCLTLEDDGGAGLEALGGRGVGRVGFNSGGNGEEMGGDGALDEQVQC
jgi:hypothetical protein